VGLAQIVVQHDVACSYAANSWGERYHWYSSTGWVMWNAQMAGLLNGTTCCIFDGNPAGRTVDALGQKVAPDWTTLWRFAADVRATFFGAGAAFFANCMKAGVNLSTCGELSQVRALGTTGSPLSEEVQNWGTQQFLQIYATKAMPHAQGKRFNAGPPQVESAPSGGSDPHAVGERGGNIWWCNISGGTDFCGAFIGSHRELPQIPGEMQCLLLGCAVEAWNEQGESVVGEVGELVCTQPMPSMPLYFWGDADNVRYLSSYFDMYPAGHGRLPGGGDAPAQTGPVWCHGDWLRLIAHEGHRGCIVGEARPGGCQRRRSTGTSGHKLPACHVSVVHARRLLVVTGSLPGEGGLHLGDETSAGPGAPRGSGALANACEWKAAQPARPTAAALASEGCGISRPEA
jgi:acetoacetyl-CoA synthetase